MPLTRADRKLYHAFTLAVSYSYKQKQTHTLTTENSEMLTTVKQLRCPHAHAHHHKAHQPPLETGGPPDQYEPQKQGQNQCCYPALGCRPWPCPACWAVPLAEQAAADCLHTALAAQAGVTPHTV